MVLKVAVMGSTNGTSLQPIIDAIESKQLNDIKISIVISNKKSAGILERGERHHLKTLFLSGKDKSRQEYDQEVNQILEENQIEIVLLIGYMKLMSSWFVEKWLNRVVNIHPSLLPAFAGGMNLNVHQAVLDRGCKVSGATLIFIDQGADTGPIISQNVVSVDIDETAERLKDKVQKEEGQMLVNFLENWRDNKIKIINHKVYCGTFYG